MQEIDEATLRATLKRKRDSLFETFCKYPSKTRLAIEIRLIDDRIASLTDQQKLSREYLREILSRNRQDKRPRMSAMVEGADKWT